jgi:3-deoxy-manno-octulosonate cytidylyltransferase (CMP-KDO synthetase)
MLQWVFENASKAESLDEVLVATESPGICEWGEKVGIPVFLTGKHPSGSDRIHEVMGSTDADVYVNIQGDEPTVRAHHIDLLISPFLDGSGTQVSTLKVAISAEVAADPNNVKVVTADDHRALYFSRYPVPYDRDGSGEVQHFKHIGLYAYTRDALGLFHSLPPSSLEKTEQLEQLRFLQNGVRIQVLETPHDTIGVDTEADLERAAVLLREQFL